MRFLMRNCLKYEQQCHNGILKKTCWATTVPNSVMRISPRYCVSNKYGKSPNTPDAKKQALQPFYSLNSKIGM